MNFFKSILLDEADPPNPENPHESGADSKLKSPEGDGNNAQEVQQRDGNADAWSFGGLIKTLATRSESVIEVYRKDLQEFGSGLRKETETIREVASRAVKDLPASLEAGTSAAHGVLDGVLKSTADIMSKEPFASSDGEKEVPEPNRNLNLGRYSWFDAQLNALQRDLNTFCEEPEDAEDYKKWNLGFQLEEKRGEIGDLAGENGVLEGAYNRVVPSVVDHENFWCRYFYKVDKLKQQEKVRANLVKRAITAHDDDDDFSWDVDEDDKDGNGDELTSVTKGSDADNGIQTGEGAVSSSSNEEEVKGTEIGPEKIEENVKCEESVKSGENENAVAEKGESSEKSSEDAVVSMQKGAEEDLGWDEIEDIGSDSENRISTVDRSERAKRADLRKQLNNDDDDEDLSWDIEDDDEPVKQS